MKARKLDHGRGFSGCDLHALGDQIGSKEDAMTNINNLYKDSQLFFVLQDRFGIRSHGPHEH